MRADTGAEVTLGELLESGARDIPVWSLDDRLKLVPRTMTHVFPSGVKEVFRLKLASGREIKATANHPFLTYDGWKPLGELVPGSRIGSLRHVPPPLEVRPQDDRHVMDSARSIDPTSPTADVSAETFGWPKRQVGAFLRELWASSGEVLWRDDSAESSAIESDHGPVRISFSSPSRRLVDAVARLLLRHNIFARIDQSSAGYELMVEGLEDQLRWCEGIGSGGPEGVRVHDVADRLRALRAHAQVHASEHVWSRVEQVLAGRHRPERGTRLAQMTATLDAGDLDVVATNDLRWDAVTSIESLGEQTVYDATVMGTHNFVAEGIATHNSLEQDADMVILLHREDAYERESTRPGEADFIVAKHRNGPTANVVVAFQGHYSRFVDMAHDA